MSVELSATHPESPTVKRRRPSRALWFLLACASIALGAIGVIVPGLPTTPFLLIAAMAAARSSPRLHAWLTGHRVFGAMIRDWNEQRAVSRRAKSAATATMLGSSALLFLLMGASWQAVGATAIMATVGTWLWRRPEPALRPERLQRA
ncbi:MAG: YbaN family protein [Gaiellaceae bacterium]